MSHILRHKRGNVPQWKSKAVLTKALFLLFLLACGAIFLSVFHLHARPVLHSERTTDQPHDLFVPKSKGPVALITGISGQDGTYLSELLLSKGYTIYGTVRNLSSDASNYEIIRSLQRNNQQRVFLKEIDIAKDFDQLEALVLEARPSEIYNLAAQSSVKASFDKPEYTLMLDAVVVLKLLVLLEQLPACRFFQASTSELFGNSMKAEALHGRALLREDSRFDPKSPYALAKQYAFSIVKNYRESKGVLGCNGILFNHESPRRGQDYVTRKITRSVARIASKSHPQQSLALGNLNAQRDWGHAKDYVRGMWMMLNMQPPNSSLIQDLVLATGKVHSIRNFCEIAFGHIGETITWHGVGFNETGRNQDGVTRVTVNPDLYRTLEVDITAGDASRAEQLLGWRPQITFETLVKEMVDADIAYLNET